MIGRSTRHLYRDDVSIRIGLPKLWIDCLGLSPREDVMLHYDQVMVLVPKQFQRSRQAVLVLRALEESTR
jgi:hypothetical protein